MTHTSHININRNFGTVSGHKTNEDACHHIGFRVTATEKLELLRLAGRKPLSRFIRDALLGGVQRNRKAYRKPKRDDVLLCKVLAALGNSRLSSNLNQIAKASNRGALPVTEDLSLDLQSACLDVRAMRMALMMALGFGGNDTFFMTAGVDWVYGGPGDDRISYENASLGTGGGVTLNIDQDGDITWSAGGFGADDHFFSIENIIGTDYNDIFLFLDGTTDFSHIDLDGGDGEQDAVIFGQVSSSAGSVVAIGGGAADLHIVNIERIIMGAQNDTLMLEMISLFGSAVNYVDGGAGDADILHLNILTLTNGAANNISLGAGAGAGIEVFGFEQIHLSALNDVITLSLTGNSDTYTLIDGGEGTDTLDLSTGESEEWPMAA